MSEIPHYSMFLEWSDEDQQYYVTLPEWENQNGVHCFMPCTHGATVEEAVKNGKEALQLLVESAIIEGQPLPAPRLVAA